jgi:hypothetical protein
VHKAEIRKGVGKHSMKQVRLRPRRGGHGHVTSYDISIGSAEARRAGMLDENNTLLEIEKLIDPENRRIIIRVIPVTGK